ncbi:hypothetical protein QJS10_CPA10g01792 [Acorus calamus]|uniref:Uncharacterized protein n=1 Tax=Acorus calamus TaxID=4465 RepID=A0AAV9E275_ACOCL|nr:hypothetical protein QJS10_CPA10g01792 [Acorus calamus]
MDLIKKTFQTLLSISIFLIFSSHITLHNFTTPSMEHVINCFTDRQAMFILLNCILLHLARESGLFGSLERGIDRREDPSMEPKSIDGEGGEASVGSLDLDLVDEEEEEEGDECLEELNKSLDLVLVDEQKEEEGDECVEELNKKFEEFIEKVRRQMGMEAMQLVMVH